MGDSGGRGSSPCSSSSSQRGNVLVIKKCEGSVKSGNVGYRIGSKDDDGSDAKCRSCSMEESDEDEMVPNLDIEAAETLMKMSNDVWGWSMYVCSSYVDGVALESGLIGYEGLQLDGDEIDNDDDQEDGGGVDDEEVDVGDSDRSNDGVDDNDILDNNLESRVLKRKKKVKVVLKKMRGASRIGDGVEGQPISLTANGGRSHNRKKENDPLFLNHAVKKVYERRKNRDGKASFGISSEDSMEGECKSKICSLVGVDKMAARSRIKKTDLGNGRNGAIGINYLAKRKGGGKSSGGSTSLTKPGKEECDLVAPTVQKAFSFSIIHLLSAVRAALITSRVKGTSEIHKDSAEGRRREKQQYLSVNAKRRVQAADLPPLVLEEIVGRVRSNPGDPRILQHPEPLKVLVRGALKVLSSEEGEKGRTALVSYRKSSRSWSWIGPVPSIPFKRGNTINNVDTSSKCWGLPWRILVIMVDSFGNWLSSHQEKLQQLESLATPPVTLTPSEMNPEERFKDVSGRKCTPTINPSSEAARAHFREEERVRYSMPDRAFAYTAVDGRKSTVAPLPRTGWKPPPRARDHSVLKPDRPGNVTILSVVRDAAARLPSGVGTRGDVCTLLRDSRYIVEDISDKKLSSVVSGALDRLHYEQDPCVQFNRRLSLWFYLHGKRGEDEFEEGGSRTTVRRRK